MSNQKLLFFITIGVLVVTTIIWFFLFSGKKSPSGTLENQSSSISIWIVGDTTEWYTPIIEGFKKKNPEYANLTIELKKFASWKDYQKTITTVLANTTGPDILAVPFWGDEFLKWKIEPLPWSLIDINSFMQKYPSFMLDDLMTDTEENGKKTAALWWIPMGYETLGMIYNKSIIPTPPTTWDEMDAMIPQNNHADTVLFGLWLGPRYIPESADILAYLSYPTRAYTGLLSGNSGEKRYRAYRDVRGIHQIPLDTETSSDIYSPSPNEIDTSIALADLIPIMDTENTPLTIYDLFVQGKIGAIFTYPSRIRELELAKKRSGESADRGTFLSAPIPSLSQEKKNEHSLASYWYFAISSKTTNPIPAGRFLAYLTSEEAMGKFIESFPTYIAAQTSFHDWQRTTVISSQFPRVTLGNFIGSDEALYSFSYGLRSAFDAYLHEYMDMRKNPPDWILGRVAKAVQCEIEHLKGENMETLCGDESTRF